MRTVRIDNGIKHHLKIRMLDPVIYYGILRFVYVVIREEDKKVTYFERKVHTWRLSPLSRKQFMLRLEKIQDADIETIERSNNPKERRKYQYAKSDKQYLPV